VEAVLFLSTGAFVEVASEEPTRGQLGDRCDGEPRGLRTVHGATPLSGTRACELRSGTSYVGGATDRRVIPISDTVKVSLSMNGGAQVPPGGGEVSLWCQSQNVDFFVDYAQMMMLQVGGFS